MRLFFAYLISLYQRKISPHKGFRCAHSGLHKGDSCSEFTKKQILDKGVFASFKSIKQRFNECREAAETIKQRPPLAQRGDCDCGLSGCDGGGFDFGSCDFGGGDSGSGGGSSSSGCNFLDCGSCDMSRRNFFRLLITLLVVGLIAASLAYYFYGRKIESVSIRMIPGIEETTDSGALAKLFRSKKPDYKINFELKDGPATTNTLTNKSAKNWISLKPNESFYLSDITQMVIVNKGITKSIELESIPTPQEKGSGELFEYSIKQRWELF